MFKKISVTLGLSMVLMLSACGEQKANTSTTPVGLMAAESNTAVQNNVAEPNPSPETNKPKQTAVEKNPITAPVNINTASSAELIATLKGTGVGKAKVENIIAYREQHGGFKSIEELKEVKGIGDKTMEKIRPRVTLSATNSNNAPDAE